jgi:nitrogen-specific signal transduction histidine kinase
MEPLLSLSCADSARRSAIAEALQRAGLELTDATAELATIHIIDDDDGLLIRNTDEVLIELSSRPSPEDIAGLARIGLELTTVWGVLRMFEDCESAGVLAANVANDARHALVPVMFAADAIARSCPGAQELTSLITRGCQRVTSILQRITPIERTAATAPTCANTVIGDLLGTMRAMAQRARLATRLETPLPQVAIERCELERMLLTLVATAAETKRNSARIIVATSSRAVTGPVTRGAPAGDWVVVEVEDDGEALDASACDRALATTIIVTPSLPSSGAGLPSLARLTRSAGGHLCIDSRRRGAKIGIWLPRVDAMCD